jgi:hypothetical protein
MRRFIEEDPNLYGAALLGVDTRHGRGVAAYSAASSQNAVGRVTRVCTSNRSRDVCSWISFTEEQRTGASSTSSRLAAGVMRC